MDILMKCGHTAMAREVTSGAPVCPICLGPEGSTPANPEEVTKVIETLKGRLAKCSMCRKVTGSKLTLPFFKHTPKGERDEYYCGCCGWD